MAGRSVEDRLREEYFDLLPDIRLVTEHLETEVRHCLLPIRRTLHKHEQMTVTARVKACDSAVNALRRRQEGRTFNLDRPEEYTLTALNDLAGVRVLAFPPNRMAEIDLMLRDRFPDWTSDPVRGDDESDAPLAFKYFGYCNAISKIRGEFQIMSMLIGLFWEVEHSAIYKPTREFIGVAGSLEMREHKRDVHSALRSFEVAFEKMVREAKAKSERPS